MSKLKCGYELAGLSGPRCGAPAVNTIHQRQNGKQIGARCAKHTANFKHSTIFESRPLPTQIS